MLLDFHISVRCPDACVFCSVSDRMRKYRRHEISWPEIRDTLIARRRDGVQYVNFTGGEPTLHKSFVRAVRLARKIGYRTCVTTNGAGLIRPDIRDATLPSLDEITLSLHGATPEVHEANSKAPGSYVRLMEALRAIDATPNPPTVRINTVMTRLNVHELPDVLRLGCRFQSVRFHLFSSISPSDDGLTNYEWTAVRMEEIGSVAPLLVKLGREAGVSVHFFGVPPCVLAEVAAQSDDFYFGRRITLEREMEGPRPYLQSVTSDNPTRLRTYPPACQGCSLKAPNLCGGIYTAYIERFGDSEIGWRENHHVTRKETLDQAHAGL